MRFTVNGTQIPRMNPSDLNCDSTLSISDRLSNTNLDSSPNKAYYIGVLTAPVQGSGDLVYGIKFVMNLMDRYKNNNIGVCFIVSGAKPHYLTMVEDRLREYNPVTNPGSTNPGSTNFGKLNIFVTSRQDNSLDILNTLIPIHILFVAPGTNLNHFSLNAPYLSEQARYIMSEYNTSAKLNQVAAVHISEVTINAGVYSPNDCLALKRNNTCPAGVFITEDKDYPKLIKGQHTLPEEAKLYFIPKDADGKIRPYVISYVYTNDDNLSQMYQEGEKPTQETSEILTVPDLGHTDISCNLQSTSNYGRAWRQSMMVMTKCFYTFLENVRQYRKDNAIEDRIIVYSTGSFLTDFRKFVILENKGMAFIKKLWHWLDSPKSPFEFATYPNLPVKEFLGFCQHSVPISFLSGDNSVMEFISVNRNPIIKIVYQSFYWKRALAKALGVKLEGEKLDTCGMATIDRAKFIRNVGNNFGITGMAQVESLIARSVNGGNLTCENTDRRTIATRLLDPNHFVYNVNTDGVLLNLSLVDNSFNTGLINGEYILNEGSILSSWINKSEKNLFVKFIEYRQHMNGTCKNFTINLNENGLKNTWVNNETLRLNEVPDCINAIIANNYINQMIKEKKRMNDMLVHTYATVMNDINCGGKKANEMFGGGGPAGVFILQEFIHGTQTFGDLFRLGTAPSELICKLLAQLYDIIWTLQEKFQMVHNDLSDSNILVEYLAEPREYKINGTTFKCHYSVRVIGFDNASVNIQNSGLRIISQSGWDYKCKEFRNYYDFAYLLANMYTMLSMGKVVGGNKDSYLKLTIGCLAGMFKVNADHAGVQSILSQNTDGSFIPRTEYAWNDNRGVEWYSQGTDFGQIGIFLNNNLLMDRTNMDDMDIDL